MHIEWHFKLDVSFKPRHLRFTKESWRRLRDKVRDRDGAICYYCGRYDPAGQVDHKIPLGRGGDDGLDNLVWSCAFCNEQKRDKTAEEYLDERNEQEWSIEDLPISEKALVALARDAMNADIRWSRRGLCRRAGIGEDRAKETLRQLRENGLLHYPKGRHHPGGAQFTDDGLSVMRALLDKHSPPGGVGGGWEGESQEAGRHTSE